MVGVQDLAWSHDGQAIFFSAMRVKRDYSDYTPEKWAVYRYHIASRTVTQLSSSSFSVAAAAREPLIIVAKLVNGNRDLYVLDENGREIGRLTSDPADDFAASWSPDGRLIAFTSRRGGHSEAYLTQRDGSNVRRLVAPSSDRTLSPTWSPDGRFIAYYREKGDGKDQIHVVLSDGSGDRNVTNDDFNNVYPGWTPDGRVVYGQGAKGARTNAVTVDTQGSEKRALLGIKSFFVRYAPDGSRVAYLEEHPESDGVRIVIARADGRVLDVVPLEAVRSPP
jgi:Tol biopolymer transport system component